MSFLPNFLLRRTKYFKKKEKEIKSISAQQQQHQQYNPLKSIYSWFYFFSSYPTFIILWSIPNSHSCGTRTAVNDVDAYFRILYFTLYTSCRSYTYIPLCIQRIILNLYLNRLHQKHLCYFI